nr:retrotransposon protein, putative, Ty1-copia subclass [Tanacetum cinerariifolium]
MAEVSTPDHTSHIPHAKIWGCEAHVKRHTPDKLQQRSVKCIFVGYPKETMGYYFYYPPENKIVVEGYADFLEKDFKLQKKSGRIVELEDEDILPSENTSEHPIEEESLAPIVSQEEDVIPVRRSVRTHKAPDRLLLPPNAKVVKSKCIYKKKTDMDGKVHIYKARLVAKGCTKTYGVDYEETFSPVADIRAIRILIAISAYYDYEIWKMDVKPAFLMASGSNVIFLILYVDDIILMGNHIPSLQEVKTYLGKCFSMKDLGEATFILGIKIYKDRLRRLIRLSQNAYLDKILKRYRMDNSKCGSIPMQVDLHLSKSQCATTSTEMKRMQIVPYASAVGSIMYDVRCTRPDVAFMQNITSRFQQNSGEAHWTAVKNILKYLRNTKDTFLVYGADPKAELRVNYYCDAGFETDRDDTKSQTGYVFVLNEGTVETPFSATEYEGIFDSGCSRSMTGNKERLDDFHAFYDGKVTFEGGERRIIGKGTIRTPTLDFENVWGCEAHVKRHTPDKLQQRSIKCIFVGYHKKTMGYYFYYPPENKIVVE